jgi:hypothetical protein
MISWLRSLHNPPERKIVINIRHNIDFFSIRHPTNYLDARINPTCFFDKEISLGR